MSYRTKDIISLTAGLLIGFTFIASGTGKLFGDLETPAQVIGFINAMIPDALLTPPIVNFFYKILVPVIFPWAELILGVALVVGFMPRLAALFTIPLVAAFMGTNIWTISTGEYSHCANCFGIWEKIFGYLSPYQSLGIDIVLALLALAVIFLQPGRFFSNRWLSSRLTGLFFPNRLKIEPVPVSSPGPDAVSKPFNPIDRLLIFVSRNGLSVAGYILGITGIVMILISASIVASPANNNSGSTGIFNADNVTVTGLTTSGGIVSFVTKSAETDDILVYDKDGKIKELISELNPVNYHAIKVDNLSPATTYYFQLLSSDATIGKRISSKYSFTTLEPPPAIADVGISNTTDSAVSITWQTDRPTSSEVIFWEEGTAENTTVRDDVSNTSHEMAIQPLEKGKVYAFMIRATDAYGHQLIGEYEGILSLKTGAQLIQHAPDFTLPTVAGDILQLSQYRGKVILLVFWNMTCPTCQKKMPLLQKAFEREDSNKIAIITVHGPGREAAIKSYCSSQGLTLPVLLDSLGDAGSSYSVMQLPATYILDQSGIIRSVNPIFETQEELDSLLNQYISR